MLWVLIAIGLIEVCAVHLLVALLWSRTAALLLSLATAGSLLWLVLLIRSFARLPVLVDGDRIVLRVGFLRGVEVGRGEVAAVRTAFAAAEVRRPDVLNLALLAFPNLLVELRAPRTLPRRKAVRAVALKLDDPAGFRAALGG